MTTKQNPGKRSRLIHAAMSLVYRHGFKETRLVDIAAEANVPPGNVYYYFKTKEQIGAAILEERLSQIRAINQRLDKLGAAQERLCAFVQMTLDNRKALARGGCPIGTLCTELNKEEDGALAQQSTMLFAEILEWLKAQFEELGEGGDSQGSAVHLLSALQGIAVVAYTQGDPDIVAMETGRLHRWIRTLGTRSAREA